MQEKRIAHIIPRIGVGGVEIAAMELAKRRIDHFRVFAVGGTKTSDPHIISSGYSNFNHPLAHLATARSVLNFNPDIVVCSLWRSVPSAIAVKVLRPRVKLVSFLHNAGFSNALDRSLHWMIARFANAFWSDSRATEQARIAQRQRNRSRVISFVLDKDLIPQASHSCVGPKFVTWCSLRHQKGIDRSIRLIGKLVELGVDASFDIYGGDAGAKNELERLTAELGLSDRVRFLGLISRSDLKTISGKKSFFLQLSRREGMAMGTIEAMQMGLVPVVTPVGEMQFYCENGRNAVVVDPERLSEAAETLSALTVDVEAYERMSKAATARWVSAPLYHEDFLKAAAGLGASRGVASHTLPPMK